MGDNFSLNGPGYPTARPAAGAGKPVEAVPAQQGWFDSKAGATAPAPKMAGDTGHVEAQEQDFEAPAEPEMAAMMQNVLAAKQGQDVQDILKQGGLSGHAKVEKLLDLTKHADPPLTEANRVKAYKAAIELVNGFGSGDQAQMLGKISHAITPDKGLSYDNMVSLQRATGRDYGATGAELKTQAQADFVAQAHEKNAKIVADYKAEQEAKSHAPKGGAPGVGQQGLQGYFDQAASASRAGAQLPFLQAMEGALGACKNQADRELVIDTCMALRNQNFKALPDYVYDMIQSKASDPTGHDAVPGGQLESYAHTKQGGVIPSYNDGI